MPEDHIQILSLRVGSLLVTIRVTRNTTINIPDSTITALLSELNISEIVALYHDLTNTNQTSDNVTMTNTQTVRGSYQAPVPEPSVMYYFTIVLPIIGGLLVLLIVIGLVWFVQRNR